MKKCFTLCVTFLLAAFAKNACSQIAPLYNFSSYTLDSGTALLTGAVYRFSNVHTNVDAFVKVTAISSGMTLKDIDRTADGYGEAFQPEYKVNSATNGYIDFKVTFVISGTNIPVLQPLVTATGLDIDGSTNSGKTLKEFNIIDMGNGVHEYNSFDSEIMISQAGSAFTGANYTGVLYGALVDTAAKEVMYTVRSSNVTSFTYRVGSDNQTTNNSTRYASLYFKNFTYQHFPLAISSLVSFDGYTTKDKVNLNWELALDGNKELVLERSFTSADFSAIAEYQLTPSAGKMKRFNYTDNVVSGGMVFYRLRSKSESGKVEYSNVLSFKMETNSVNKLSVFPTLVQQTATVSIHVPGQTTGYLQVTDLNGRAVKQQQLSLKEGNNSISVNGFGQLSKGQYIVSVRTGTTLLSKQVIVQ